MLNVTNLNKQIDGKKILNNISFSVNPNEIVSIIGHSGAGKTTIVRVLNGLTPLDSGEISIDGETIDLNSKKVKSKLHEQIGLVFQNFNLYPHLTVLENITLSPRLKEKNNKNQIIKQAKKWLSILKLEDKEQQYPFELSGGEKQRVAIARACMLNPKILCFDEPTSALDPGLRDNIAELIKTLQTENITVLVITHDMDFARKISDKIIVLEKGSIDRYLEANQFFN